MNPGTNPALLPPSGLDGASRPAGIPGAPAGGARPPREAPLAGARSFVQELQDAGAAHSVRFSRHALARVERRGIELDLQTLTRLSEGVQRAASKGSRDSLVLVDGTAFVVSVNNNTVITAVGSEHMKDNVFTNIDSAVIA
jgi:flagellar operon protein